MTRPEPPIDRYEGCHWEPHAEDEDHWRVTAGKRCRGAAGYHKPACGKPAVAEVHRKRRSWAGVWWAYCPEHMYGRWVENGVVYGWRLVEDREASDA